MATNARDIDVFSEAIQLPEHERLAFLDRACAGDEELRRRVIALLKSNDRAGEFLETPPTGSIGQQRARVVVGEKPGDQIERYKLLRQIGEGGCGVVFVAEQEGPVRRLVALKVVKPGMDTESVIARFEAERQALALMDHPNIAHVFDAGATASGRPYFVMELVEGVKITTYCDLNSLGIRARLALFAQVCDAIQHAHQKGIIHRDIKPSNVLVATGSDGKPAPKVIDFGIAKATVGMQLTDKTIFTAQEMLIGTPAYMSPEQAALTSEQVDTRTDIYSLGVMLYELLTGLTPFDAGKLAKAGLDEMRRVIREQEPARPSTRLHTMTQEELKVEAVHRRTNPPTLVRVVRGDLDWIAMKAMEKDRTRRYATAHGLALDVQRYLANEPVSARPPSASYKFQKLVRRNKLIFAAIGVVALLLVVSLIIVSRSLAREKKMRHEADTASGTSQEVTTFLEDMISRAGPAIARGRDTAIFKDMLDQTTDSLRKGMSIQPVVEASMRRLIGKLYEDMGQYDKAEEMESRALAIRLHLFGPNDLETAESLNDFGLEEMALHKLPQAESSHAQALAIRRRQLGEENTDTATSLNDLGAVYRDEGKLKEAEIMAKEALAIRRRLFGTDTNLDVADSLRNLSIIYGTENRWDEAKKTAEEVLAIRRKILGPDHLWVASSLEDVAWAASGLGQYDEAELMEEDALDLRQKVLGDQHPDVGRTLNAVGQLLSHRNELPTADAVLKATLSIQRKLVGDDQRATLETYRALGQALNSEGKLDEAESIWREALVAWGKRGDDENKERLYTLRGLAETLEQEHKWAEAEPVWRESLDLWRKREGAEEKESMYTLRRLGLALEAERKWPEAEAIHREAFSISHKNGNENPEALADLEKLTRVLANQKKYAEEKELLNTALVPPLITQAASASLLSQRVDINGRLGRWPEAAADAALALENASGDHYRYHVLAALLAVLHDRPAYEKLCGRLITKFPDTPNPYIAERVAQDCLLLPDSGVDLQLTDKLADIAVNRGSAEGSLPYFLACKAMSSYRTGHFQAAVVWAEKAANTPNVETPAQAKADAILAMAHWRLGQQNEARAAFAQGDALAPKLSSNQQNIDLGDSWMAWLMARISLDEADTLLKSPTPAKGDDAQK